MTDNLSPQMVLDWIDNNNRSNVVGRILILRSPFKTFLNSLTQEDEDRYKPYFCPKCELPASGCHCNTQEEEELLPYEMVGKLRELGWYVSLNHPDTQEDEVCIECHTTEVINGQ